MAGSVSRRLAFRGATSKSAYSFSSIVVEKIESYTFQTINQINVYRLTRNLKSQTIYYLSFLYASTTNYFNIPLIPTTVFPSGTDFVIIAPAPIITLFPMVISPIIFAPAPMKTLFPI